MERHELYLLQHTHESEEGKGDTHASVDVNCLDIGDLKNKRVTNFRVRNAN